MLQKTGPSAASRGLPNAIPLELTETNNMKAIKEIIRGALCFAAVLYASAFIREPAEEGGEA